MLASLDCPRLAAATLTVILAAVVVTPLCGFLFGCGCTWPWAGLEAHCNVHDASAPAHCPWCMRPAIASLTFAIATSVGVVAAVAGRLGASASGQVGARRGTSPRATSGSPAVGERPWLEIARRTLTGLSTYAALSTAAAWLIAQAASYPAFLR